MANEEELIFGVDEYINEKSTSLRHNFMYASDKDPDQRAQVQQLARIVGAPIDSAARNFDRLKSSMEVNAFDAASVVRDYPKFSDFFSDANNAEVAYDDYANLTELEAKFGLLRTKRRPTPTLANSLSSIGSNVLLGYKQTKNTAEEMIADLFGGDSYGQSFLDKNFEIEQEIGYLRPDFESGAAGQVYDAASMLARQAPALAASVAAGSMLPTLIDAYTANLSISYPKYRERGASPLTAFSAASAEGGLEVLGSILPTKYIVANFGKKGLSQFAGELLLRELPGEVVTQHLQDAVDTAVANPTKTWQQYFDERPDVNYNTVVQTTLASGMLGGASGLVAHRPMLADLADYTDALRNVGKNTRDAAATSEEKALSLATTLTAAADSKLRTRYPDKFKEFVASVVEEGSNEVFINPAALKQEELDNLVRVFPDTQKTLAEAVATGSDIRISIADVVTYTPKSDIENTILQHARLSPEDMSAAEVESFKRDQGVLFQEEMQAQAAKAQLDNQYQESRQLVEEEIHRQLEATKRYTSDIARTQATWASSFYSTLAANTGMNPQDFYVKYGAAINAEEIFKDTALDRKGKGVKGQFDIETNTVSLFKNADLSTLIHEQGHVALNIYEKLAQQESIPQFIKDDLDTLLRWGEVQGDTPQARLANWASKDIEGKRKTHEKVARGMEVYMFEGKAPSLELRHVFSRLRSWLMQIYKSIKALNVELTPEVRNVFDRMFATNDEIKTAEYAASLTPLFTEKPASMSDAEWEAYRSADGNATTEAVRQLESRSLRDMKWLSNATDRKIKELQTEAKDVRAMVRKEVESEVMAERVNRLRTFLRSGEIDGKPVEGSYKLNIAAVKETLGDDYAKLDNKFGKYGILAKDGLPPNGVAEMFGYTSADEMLRDMINAENANDKIEGITDSRMIERYSDLATPEDIKNAAQEAIHNDMRGRVLATSLNALNKMLGKRKISLEAAKEYAAEALNKLKARDVRPAFYEAAEVRSGREAKKLLAKNDIQGAAEAQRRQLINFYIAKEARAFLAEQSKGRDKLAKFVKQSVRDKIAEEELDQIDTLLERVDLSKGTTFKTIDKRASLRTWLDAKEEEGLAPEIPEFLQNEAYRISYKEMTVEQFRGLMDTVKQIEHLGRNKEKALREAELKALNVVRDEIAESVTKNASGKVDLENWSYTSPTAKGLLRFHWMHRKASSVARQMDGFKDQGPLWNHVIRPMNDAGNMETEMRADATKRLGEILKPLLSGGLLGKSASGKYYDSVGRSFNREQRIAIALNMGNTGNRQRVLGGEGWTMAQVQPILDDLTKTELDVIQAVFDFNNSYLPQIQAMHKRQFGVELDLVQATPIVTKNGTIPGGYYNIVYDRARSARTENLSDAEIAKELERGAMSASVTRDGYTKARAKEVFGRPLLYTIDGVFEGTGVMIRNIAWRDWLIDTNRIMRGKSVDSAIRNHYGPEGVRLFKDLLKDIAQGDTPATNAFESGLAHVRNGATIAAMGWSVTTAMLQPLGLANSWARIGAADVAKGMMVYMRNPIETTKMVHAKSSLMRHRGMTMNRELNDIKNHLNTVGYTVQGMAKLVGAERAAAIAEVSKASMFYTIQKAQQVADVPTWLGVYQRELAKGTDDGAAVALADQAVLDAQGGGQIKDLSAIQRGGPLQKLFTNFYSYFNTVYNINVEIYGRTNFRDPVNVAKATADFLVVNTLPAVMAVMLKTALDIGDDDEDMWKKLANEQISSLMGTMVGVRETTAAMQKMFGVNSYNGSYSGPASLRFFSEMDKLATQIHQGEADSALRRAFLNAGGVLLHLPSTQINRTWDGYNAWLNDDAGFQAILTGAPK